MNINNGGPAFPNPSGDDRDNNSMALRDYFAARALQGLLSHDGNSFSTQHYDWYDFATDAYNLADAMLKAREVSND